MLTALTKSKKPHQIATGFDQSSHATLIGLPPQALPNAHESVIRLTYKARSSQTFMAAAAGRSSRRGAARIVGRGRSLERAGRHVEDAAAASPRGFCPTARMTQ